MDQSTAIQCPSVAVQLLSSKIFQMVLTEPGVLERYLDDEDERALVRGTFAGMYPVDDSPDGQEAMSRAIADPHQFVLKPQREGGGSTAMRSTGLLLSELWAQGTTSTARTSERCCLPWDLKSDAATC